MNNKKQPTIYDIAEHLGVSTGTVYRALNNKGRISEETKQRVLKATAELGYKANKAAQSLRRNPLNIGVILCCPVPQYLNEINNGLLAAFNELAQFNVFSDIRNLGYCNCEDCEEDIRRSLDDFDSKEYQGIILYLSGNNTSFNDKLTALLDKGVKLATVANDISGIDKAISVSVDGFSCGKLAAEILSLSCNGGDIAILTGSPEISIHKSKIDGFGDYASMHSSFSEIHIFDHKDSERSARMIIDDIFSKPHTPDGIYITSAISQYACNYIKDLSLKNSPRIITTDLFGESRELLSEGITCATIFQNPFKQAKRCVLKLYDYITENHTGCESYPLIPQAIFTSNMTLYDAAYDMTNT